ncbi:hypothetical protein [Halomontanus rarus]|uniref:hypothetical protein n=1 Tax=Halomontanus rarus TaxID=3034020 RepID=UPI0023E7A462|nr:hypothetical protein [Halovivax sp. TS33]
MSIIFGVLYFGILFEVIPTIYPLLPRSEMIFISRGFSITLFGSYLVVILIDRSYRESEEQDQHRRETIALQQLTAPINRNLTLLGNWYVASKREKPNEPPKSYNELFGPDYFESVKCLDFSKEYKTGNEKTITWLSWSAKEMIDLRENIDETVKKYGDSMDTELVENLQSLSGSSLGSMIIQIEQTNALECNSNNSGKKAAPLLASEGWEDSLEKHVESLLNISQYYEENNSMAVSPVDKKGFWRDDIFPRFGVGNIEYKENDDSDSQWTRL